MDPQQSASSVSSVAKPAADNVVNKAIEPIVEVKISEPILPDLSDVIVLSRAQKEMESLISQSGDELMRPEMLAPKLSNEVMDAGVISVLDVPILTSEDKNAGIELSKESVVFPSQPTSFIHLSTSQQAEEVLKKKSVYDSIAWIATLVLRQLKMISGKKEEGKDA